MLYINLSCNPIKSQRSHLWESLQEVFVMLVAAVVLLQWRFLIHWFSISSLALMCIYSFCTFSSVHHRVICNTFVLCYGSERALFTHRRFLPCTPFSNTKESRNTPFRIFLYICCHRVFLSDLPMVWNYWCSSYKIADLLIILVSHEV